MIRKTLASIIAVVGSAALTLAVMIALVQGTIAAVSIDNLLLRIPALVADVLFGTALLLGCIYVATHLAVRILGVGDANFPPLPEGTNRTEPPQFSGASAQACAKVTKTMRQDSTT